MNKCTLVTGLWDINRKNLTGSWKRPYEYYLEKFSNLLKTDNNLIIFGDKNLKEFVFKRRNHDNTQFVETSLDWFRNNDYYSLIQDIRNNDTWLYQNDWISQSPQGSLDMYNPIVMSKINLLNKAILGDKFNSEYFYWIDGGIRVNKNYFKKETIENISNHTNFFFISFPYEGKEIHGFDSKEIEKIISTSPDMVCRATFFGGNKKNISLIHPLYNNLMMKTLSNGFMGTEESLFTILTYTNPELIDYYKLDEKDNGDVEGFFKKFISYSTKDINNFFKTKDRYSKLPISIGILSWNSNKTLKNTLESYKKNGLFKIVNDVVILFQECSETDIQIAKEYNISFIACKENLGISEAFIKLAQGSKSENILLLEHDWELVENISTTYERLKSGIDLLNLGFHCIRYRHRKNPGYPLYSRNVYEGNELNHYDKSIDLISPHLIESIHWIENPEVKFEGKIYKNKDYYVTTSRWSNFTNNPCMYNKNFYLDCILPFRGGKSNYDDYKDNFHNYRSVNPQKYSLEVDIGHWWSRQNFKVAQGEGLFTHNDIEKHGITQPMIHISEQKQNTISFIFAHRETDKWTTPLSIVNEFKRLGWNTNIYSLFDSNGNYTDNNIHKLLKTNPDIIIHMDWGQHTSTILKELRKTGAFCIMESGDDPQRFSSNLIKAPWFDLILSPDIRSVEEYKKHGYNAEWWTHFTDTQFYYPLNIEPTYLAVCSRGVGNGAHIIDRLSQKYPNKIINQNGFQGIEHNKFLNSAEIILQQSRYGEITRRIFEGLSCKKLVLTDRLDVSTKIQDLFLDGEDIVYYDDEIDCLNKIIYYCNNQEEAKRIAENGYNKVLNNHTEKQRVQFIIDKWKMTENLMNLENEKTLMSILEENPFLITDKNTVCYKKYPDKWDWLQYHSYVENFYERAFKRFKKKSNVNICEIGIDIGGSIALWSKYFEDGNVFGIDINSVRLDEQYREENFNNVKYYINNAYDKHFIKSLPFFDIIIDDGPHTFASMLIFIEEYIHKLNDGGIMIIEDIPDIKWVDYFKSLVPSGIKTTIVDLREIDQRYDSLLFAIEKL